MKIKLEPPKKSPHFFDRQFTPVNELPRAQCTLSPELIREFAIAIYANKLEWLENTFSKMEEDKKQQFFNLYIIYNQLGDKFLEKSGYSKLKDAKTSGYPLHLAEQLKHGDMHQFFTKKLQELTLDTELEAENKITRTWKPDYFISTLHLADHYNRDTNQDENTELRFF